MKPEFPKATQRQTPHHTASSRLASGMLPAAPYLTWNVRKITWSHIPQPASQSTSHYKTSLKPKPPKHFEILPAMGKGWRSEEESGRKKNTTASPPQFCFSSESLVLPFTHTVKAGAIFFSFVLFPLEKETQKPYPPLHLQRAEAFPERFAGELDHWNRSFHWATGSCTETTFTPSISYV